MKKYEYLLLNMGGPKKLGAVGWEEWLKEINERFNQLGAEGWKAVNFSQDAYGGIRVMILFVREISS